MYQFYFGAREEIERDPRRYLLAIKRNLPRWANSLPDSEYLLLMDLIESLDLARQPVFVETGVGASTILFLHYAMLSGGRVLSWDVNSSKGSFIRSVCADTLELFHGKAMSEHWTFVSSLSLDPYIGVSAAAELTPRIDLSHHDSDHTWETVKGEIDALIPLYSDGAIVCVDDANQDYQRFYEPIINVTRCKVGLPPIQPIAGNRGEPHYQKIPALLRSKFAKVESVHGRFAEYLKSDPYYAWYSADRQSMESLNMERMENLEKRFGAWRVSNRHGKDQK